MVAMLSTSVATTRLDHIRHNLDAVRARVGDRQVLAAVKANAYGHGAVELAQMIRQPESKGNPFAPIIMLSGHSEKRRVTIARDAGVTEFLAKPISAKGLYQRILNVVANPRPFIKTKHYFGPDRRRNVNASYIGIERRNGGRAEVMQQPSLLDKVRSGN